MSFGKMQNSHVALVTGGARGIGLAIANALAASGVRVVTPAREELDLANPSSIDAYAEVVRAEGVDILVNNAGINPLSDIDTISSQDWSATLQVNLSAPLRLLQEVVPEMKNRKWGRVVNISSIFGVISRAKRGSYSSSKAGLLGLTRTAAVELAPYGILVNSVCPGYVETELTRQNNSPEALAQIAADIPLRRLAAPEEIAKVVAFLCHEDNSYITGQTILADGGLTCV